MNIIILGEQRRKATILVGGSRVWKVQRDEKGMGKGEGYFFFVEGVTQDTLEKSKWMVCIARAWDRAWGVWDERTLENPNWRLRGHEGHN